MNHIYSIKPLQWEDGAYSNIAFTLFGHYIIEKSARDTLYYLSIQRFSYSSSLGKYRTLDAAKSAAQEHQVTTLYPMLEIVE